jgi:hypothetical protein
MPDGLEVKVPGDFNTLRFSLITYHLSLFSPAFSTLPFWKASLFENQRGVITITDSRRVLDRVISSLKVCYVHPR